MSVWQLTSIMPHTPHTHLPIRLTSEMWYVSLTSRIQTARRPDTLLLVTALKGGQPPPLSRCRCLRVGPGLAPKSPHFPLAQLSQCSRHVLGALLLSYSAQESEDWAKVACAGSVCVGAGGSVLAAAGNAAPRFGYGSSLLTAHLQRTSPLTHGCSTGPTRAPTLPLSTWDTLTTNHPMAVHHGWRGSHTLLTTSTHYVPLATCHFPLITHPLTLDT